MQPGVLLDAGVLHDPENLSGHAPIYIKLNLEKAYNKMEDCYRSPRINWQHSSDQQKGIYSDNLDKKLQSIKIPRCCENILCANKSHHQALNQTTAGILSAVTESAWDHLEQTKGTTGDQKSRKHTIPGWNRFVRPYREEAAFWFNLWSSAGKPRESTTPGIDHELFSAMRHSRNQFNYAVKGEFKKMLN